MRPAAEATATRPSVRPRPRPPRPPVGAEAEATRAKGLAEAEAIKARADALAENQEAVIAQQLAEKWPEIVPAGAAAFGNVDQMMLLNGAEGMSEMFTSVLGTVGSILPMARTLLASQELVAKPDARRRAPTGRPQAPVGARHPCPRMTLRSARSVG